MTAPNPLEVRATGSSVMCHREHLVSVPSFLGSLSALDYLLRQTTADVTVLYSRKLRFRDFK